MDIEPLPSAGIGEVLGLLEMLEDARGKEDIFELAKDLFMELDDIGPVIEAARILGFVDTVNGDISITEAGATLLNADINERKKILADSILKLHVFKSVLEFLMKRNKNAKRDAIIKFFSKKMADEDAEKLFETLVEWGRFAEILSYDAKDEILYLEI